MRALLRFSSGGIYFIFQELSDELHTINLRTLINLESRVEQDTFFLLDTHAHLHKSPIERFTFQLQISILGFVQATAATALHNIKIKI